jgi:hypothetical protein
MTIKQKIKYIFFYLLVVSNLFTLNMVHAQLRNDADIYISDNSTLFIDFDNYDFGTGTITTSRTKLDYGILSFSQGATWDGANDEHFIDGYAKTESNYSFILPIGQSGVYAPIQVIPTNFEGVNAAYFREAASSVGSELDSLTSSISLVEYWNIESTTANATISLSYRPSSAVSDLTSSLLANLTIVGWNEKSWVVIPSALDKYSITGTISSFEYGSISSNKEVDLSVFSAFSLGSTTVIVEPDLTVYIHKNRLFVEASLPINALSIYDMQGKIIFSRQLNGSLKHKQDFYFEENIYLIQVELKNGASVITKKVINRN